MEKYYLNIFFIEKIPPLITFLKLPFYPELKKLFLLEGNPSSKVVLPAYIFFCNHNCFNNLTMSMISPLIYSSKIKNTQCLKSLNSI